MSGLPVDLVRYNVEFLDAWTRRDIPGLLDFYSPAVVFHDPFNPDGLHGHDELREHLVRIFDNDYEVSYDPREVWPTPDGYFGVWISTRTESGAETRHSRGFDYIVMDGDKIVRNDVYVHRLENDLTEGF